MNPIHTTSSTDTAALDAIVAEQARLCGFAEGELEAQIDATARWVERAEQSVRTNDAARRLLDRIEQEQAAWLRKQRALCDVRELSYAIETEEIRTQPNSKRLERLKAERSQAQERADGASNPHLVTERPMTPEEKRLAFGLLGLAVFSLAIAAYLLF